MDIHELKAVVEALIFASESPIKLERLAEVLDLNPAEVSQALDALQDDYTQHPRGFFLQNVAGGYELRTRPEYADHLRRMGRSRPFRFSRPAMETLAIIAYRQPVTRAEIEYLRGVDSGSVIKTLLEKRLVRILGKKDVPGKPMIYGTTKEFLELFGLPDLSALPTLREFNELIPEDGFEEITVDGDLPLLAEEGDDRESVLPDSDSGGDQSES
ncbi:MAG: SMC-Scp complex subunit ScpB [Deltaproteobacteria bacterium]|nr:SMC-Scp complex subunit ScpB [Deltaproteobacteria bacterium]